MPQKDEVELDITNVAHGGVFVARYEGRVVFVPDTIPGERVRVRVADRAHDRFWHAELLEVLVPAPERREHIWGAASVRRAPGERVGGAEFGHIRLDHQRELKRRVIEDALQRTARLDAETIGRLNPAGGRLEVEAAAGETEDGVGWRTRVRLQVGPDGALGHYAARTHAVVPVTELPLATPAVEESAPLGQQFPGAASVDVVGTGLGVTHVLVNDLPLKRSKSTVQPRRRPVPIRERVGKREFRLDARGFWQVHREAAATLTAAVRSAVDEAVFDPRAANLDLYGGVGLFASVLGDRFGPTLRITSVESDEGATDSAAENLAEWVGARAVTARVEHFVAGLAAEASATERARLRSATVVLDPPRSGAGRAVVEALVSVCPAQIVYVACDPVALARDVAYFTERGYVLRSLRAFDLFPNTHHVEAIVTLTPARQ